MAGLAPLIAQTALEAGVVAWAGWELWKLRSPRPKPPPAPSADPARHPVGQQPLDDGRA